MSLMGHSQAPLSGKLLTNTRNALSGKTYLCHDFLQEGSAEQLKKVELNSWKETRRASVFYAGRRFYGVFGAVRESAAPGVCPQTRMNHGFG